jgi:acyl-CoA reductase-like NAD-dependent aldehyde dehydrogenase
LRYGKPLGEVLFWLSVALPSFSAKGERRPGCRKKSSPWVPRSRPFGPECFPKRGFLLDDFGCLGFPVIAQRFFSWAAFTKILLPTRADTASVALDSHLSEGMIMPVVRTSPLLLIGNRWVDGAESYPLRDPYWGKLLAEVPLADLSLCREAIRIAHEAFAESAREAPCDRAERLLRVASLMEKRREDFVQTMVGEVGKPKDLAASEVERAVVTFQAAAEEARREQGELLSLQGFPRGRGYFGWVQRFPLGVVLAITPFNFPLNTVAHKVAPCLATGNTLVLKPSPKAPLTAMLLGEVLLEAGILPGQFNLILCRNEDVPELITDPRVRKVSFTGSAEVGWRLKALAPEKRFTLELGGNAAVIVDETCRWRDAVVPVAWGAFAYAGQSCISVQRVLVHRSIYQAFREELVAFTTKEVRTGDPSEPGVWVGPLIDQKAREKIGAWLEHAQKKGAGVLCGGRFLGPCLEPTILETDRRDLEVVQEEVFAPLLVLSSFESFQQALERVNDSAYGLQAGVFTSDLSRAMLAFRTLEVGAVLVNQVPTFRIETMPYGGVKRSGFGREGIRYAMEAMTEPRVCVWNLN